MTLEIDPEGMSLGEIIREITEITIKKTLDCVVPCPVILKPAHMIEYNREREQALYQEINKRELKYLATRRI